MKRIVLENNKLPEFIGAWTVGEVLQMAQQLAAWVERLQVSSPEPIESIEVKHENETKE